MVASRLAAHLVEVPAPHLEPREPQPQVEVDLRQQPVQGPVARPTGRVSRKPFVPPAAQQLMHRNPERLALQVPQRRLDRADHGRTNSDPSPVNAAVDHPLAQRVDIQGIIGMEQDRREELNDGGYDSRQVIPEIRLAQAGDPLAGLDLDECRASPRQRLHHRRIVADRPGQQHGTDIGDLHPISRSRRPRPVVHRQKPSATQFRKFAIHEPPQRLDIRRVAREIRLPHRQRHVRKHPGRRRDLAQRR